LAEDQDEMEMTGEGLPELAEPRYFAPEQMVRCEACLRANPPTRTSCLYCGEALPVTAEGLQRPTLRQLEKWEQGYNTILLPKSATHTAAEALGEIAGWLRLGAEDLKMIIEADQPLPLARAATQSEADLIERKLNGLGFGVLTVADQSLMPDETGPRRARALDFDKDALHLYPTGGGVSSKIEWADFLLLVAGRLFTRQLDVEERRRRGSEREIVNASEVSADEAVLDLYEAGPDAGWRISANNFDFSCLGQKKSLLAAENFQTLVALLRQCAPQAIFDDSYNRARQALSAVWRPEQRTESGGLRHGRFGKFNTGSITIIDYQMQFTRYSRLRHFLKLHHPELVP
jgi:hypothetical protein